MAIRMTSNYSKKLGLPGFSSHIKPKFLADALTIGSTLRLIDGISPVKATDPSGNFCVLMPWRCVAEDAPEAGGGDRPLGAVVEFPLSDQPRPRVHNRPEPGVDDPPQRLHRPARRNRNRPRLTTCSCPGVQVSKQSVRASIPCATRDCARLRTLGHYGGTFRSCCPVTRRCGAHGRNAPQGLEPSQPGAGESEKGQCRLKQREIPAVRQRAAHRL